MPRKPRIAVVSPFLDKRHGTERCVAEQIERIAGDYEIHLYSSAVEDLDLSRIKWHRVPRLPVPHLISYVWFFAANHFMRWWDRAFKGRHYDLVFSPGINCLDADIVAVHIVFAEYYRLAQSDLALRRNPIRTWPWLIHRKLSYRLFVALEQRVYARKSLSLTVISSKMEADLERCFNRRERLSRVYHGVDLEHLHPARRQSLRDDARQKVHLPANAFALLLIGNDWSKKGVPCLIEAVCRLANSNLWILLRGQDGSSSCRELLRKRGLDKRTIMLPSIPEIEFHYAAADAYVGPSLEDSFAIPPLEAMACGLPVIVSRQAGAAELVTHGVDGLILEDPRDSRELAALIRQLSENAKLCQCLGSRAADTAQRFTWQSNADQMKAVFDECLREKRLKSSQGEPKAAFQV